MFYKIIGGPAPVFCEWLGKKKEKKTLQTLISSTYPKDVIAIFWTSTVKVRSLSCIT